MNQKEQKIYRKIVNAQFEPYDPGEKPHKDPRPFQRRMLARMVIDICRRVHVVRVVPHVEPDGEMMCAVDARLNYVSVDVARDGHYFVWEPYSKPMKYTRGRYKQRVKGVRAAVRWLMDETYKPYEEME